MIESHDRSGYFGASDTDKIVGKWGSPSWQKWWLEKLGIARNTFTNEAMNCGTMLEHRILEFLDIPEMEFDKQIIIEEECLRVNLDGNTTDTNYEVKTYKEGKAFALPRKYINQTQVQMYASKLRKTILIAYAVTDRDYKNYFLPIDPQRITLFPIEYDEHFVTCKYLPRLRKLAEHLKKGEFPCDV